MSQARDDEERSMGWSLKQVHTCNIFRMIHTLDEPLTRQYLQLTLQVSQLRRCELELIRFILHFLMHQSPAHTLCRSRLHRILILLTWTHSLSSCSELLLFTSLLHLCCWLLHRALTFSDAESYVRPCSLANLLSSQDDLHSCGLCDVQKVLRVDAPFLVLLTHVICPLTSRSGRSPLATELLLISLWQLDQVDMI